MAISTYKRARIYERDNWACVYCGKAVNGNATLDHVVPRMLGGSDEEGNLVTACPPCNREKGAAIGYCAEGTWTW